MLHDRLLDKVLRLPMSFFDTQPTGRLVNRFTKDVESTDVTLQGTISSFTTCFVSVFMSTFVISAVTRGAVFIAFAPLLFVYRGIQRYYLATTRELKRLDSVALSPIFSNFSETLTGLATVRAFRRQSLFAHKNAQLMDGSARVWWPIQVRPPPSPSITPHRGLHIPPSQPSEAFASYLKDRTNTACGQWHLRFMCTFTHPQHAPHSRLRFPLHTQVVDATKHVVATAMATRPDPCHCMPQRGAPAKHPPLPQAKVPAVH